MKKATLQCFKTIFGNGLKCLPFAAVCLFLLASFQANDLNAQRPSQISPQIMEQLEERILIEIGFLKEQASNPQSSYDASNSSNMAAYYSRVWSVYSTSDLDLSEVLINETNYFVTLDNTQDLRDNLFYSSLREAHEDGVDVNALTSSPTLTTGPVNHMLLKKEHGTKMNNVDISSGSFTSLSTFFFHMRGLL
ncbi:MAG: hypothetical protein EA409_09185 [Saprospirales bacterium]|nr:MAG: hypothetical protein EA409_09185 [Saprospirales bacterium]